MAAKDNYIEVENAFLGPEIHYCVVFRGETERYGSTDEIETFLDAEYKIKPRMFDTASQRQPLIIFGPADFHAAAKHFKRIREYGITCTVEAVEPPGKQQGPRFRVLEATQIPKARAIGHKPAGSQETASSPGGNASDDLYSRLNTVYDEVKTEFNIAEAAKVHEKKETSVGCFIFIFAVMAVGAVIFTPLSWFWAAAGIFIIVTVLGSMLKEWNLLYVDSFLAKLEDDKQRDPKLFARTMKKWVKNLPKNDRAKKHLETVVLKLEQEARTAVSKKPAPRTMPPSTPPPAPPPRAQAPRPTPEKKTTPPPQPPPTPPTFPAASAKTEDVPICPKCGSDWIRSEEKGRGKIIYTCENCQKKWKEKR